MKKILAMILVLSLLVPTIALADLPDVSALSDQELKDLIAICSAELRERNTTEPEGTLLFDYDGLSVYQTGDAVLTKNGNIEVPILVINDRSVATSFGIREASCNGWEVTAFTGTALSEKTKRKDTIRISAKDVGLESLDDVESLIFKWTATEGAMYVYKGEREEHRFW